MSIRPTQPLKLIQEYVNLSSIREKKALKKALSETLVWLEDRAMSKASVFFGISKKELIRRFKASKTHKKIISNKSSTHEGHLWIGLNRIGLHRFGDAVQTKIGVRVGRRFARSAFINQSLNNVIFKRVKIKSLPIQRVNIDVEQELTKIMQGLEVEAVAMFQEKYKEYSK